MRQRSPSAEDAALFERALDLHRSGELAQAARLYERLLHSFPGHPDLLNSLGTLALQQRNLDEGTRLLGLSLKARPGQPLVLCNLGAGLHDLGRRREALDCYDRAIALQPDLAEAHSNLALVLNELGRWDEALRSADRAVALAPGHAGAWNNRGMALHRLRRLDEALACYDRALALKPDHAEALSNRGFVLNGLGRWDEALASCDRALATDPNHALAHNNRGAALLAVDRIDDALASFDRAIAAKPEGAEAHRNRGLALQMLGRRDDALACFERALALDPGNADAIWSKALLKLALGEYDEGWRLYEIRWRTGQVGPARNFPEPLWLGEMPIADRTILVHGEQGLGDFIQFCRYVPLLAARGARVVLETPEPLVALAGTLGAGVCVVPSGAPLPRFDLHCPIMSLPLAFGTTLETIPRNVPYLHCDAVRSARWAERLGERRLLRVGLVWSGGFRPNQPDTLSTNRRRNIPLSRLAILDVPGVEFFSLQKGSEGERQLADLAAAHAEGPRIVDHTGEFADFSDTAAFIDNLDLVISVDTSTAHLAGAMGKPTWILNRYDACWRWLLDRTDSPWYPTVTLFRQSSFNDWTDVVAGVRKRLTQEALGHR